MMAQLVLEHPGEPMEYPACVDCAGPLAMVPCESDTRCRFAFSMTHRRDGTPIKHLDTKGAFLGIIELGWCASCEKHTAVLDSTDDAAYWNSLPKWETRQ